MEAGKPNLDHVLRLLREVTAAEREAVFSALTRDELQSLLTHLEQEHLRSPARAALERILIRLQLRQAPLPFEEWSNSQSVGPSKLRAAMYRRFTHLEGEAKVLGNLALIHMVLHETFAASLQVVKKWFRLLREQF